MFIFAPDFAAQTMMLTEKNKQLLIPNPGVRYELYFLRWCENADDMYLLKKFSILGTTICLLLYSHWKFEGKNH